MSDTAPLVTAAEISRLAGVTRATVSNWRRRHANFPGPAGGSESRPLFDLHQVQQWLGEHGVDATESPLHRLRTLLRAQVPPHDVPELIDALAEILGKRGAASNSVSSTDEISGAIRAAVEEAGPLATLEALAERGLEENPTTGVYPTPAPVADLMIALVEAAAGAAPRSVLDPACGSGALLATATRTGARDYYGQDVLPVQAKRTAALLALTDGVGQARVRAGDSLFDDEFSGLEADVVVSNPPYAQRDWGAEELVLDPRWEYGVPPRSESELAWLQHALAHLRPGGLAVLLLPPAVAVRSSGRRIRAALLRAGAVRSVIALPPPAYRPAPVGIAQAGPERGGVRSCLVRRHHTPVQDAGRSGRPHARPRTQPRPTRARAQHPARPGTAGVVRPTHMTRRHPVTDADDPRVGAVTRNDSCRFGELAVGSRRRHHVLRETSRMLASTVCRPLRNPAPRWSDGAA
jgi:tRNA1(Val) A37 N6-methylase TrmN6